MGVDSEPLSWRVPLASNWHHALAVEVCRGAIGVVAYLVGTRRLHRAEEHDVLAGRGHVGEQRVTRRVVAAGHVVAAVGVVEVHLVQDVPVVRLRRRGVRERVARDQERLVGDHHEAPAHLDRSRAPAIGAVGAVEHAGLVKVAGRGEVLRGVVLHIVGLVDVEARVVDDLVDAPVARVVQLGDPWAVGGRLRLVERGSHPDCLHVLPVREVEARSRGSRGLGIGARGENRLDGFHGSHGMATTAVAASSATTAFNQRPGEDQHPRGQTLSHPCPTSRA